MALKHAILVALAEHPGSGYTLARRFDKSLGFFWSATHQQIYRVLAELESSGELQASIEPGVGKPDSKIYELTASGRIALANWLAQATALDQPKSELALKVRGIHFGDQSAVIREIRSAMAEHQKRLDYYLADAEKNYPDPTQLSPDQRGPYLVLRGGIRTETAYLDWCTEMLELLHLPEPLSPNVQQ